MWPRRRNGAQLLELGKVYPSGYPWGASGGRNGAQLLELGKVGGGMNFSGQALTVAMEPSFWSWEKIEGAIN